MSAMARFRVAAWLAFGCWFAGVCCLLAALARVAS